jgi:hypothetical protein
MKEFLCETRLFPWTTPLQSSLAVYGWVVGYTRTQYQLKQLLNVELYEKIIAFGTTGMIGQLLAWSISRNYLDIRLDGLNNVIHISKFVTAMIYKAALIREEQALSVLRNYTTILIAE